MFDGSLRGKSDPILVFVNLIASANRFGEVDRHFRAIADETGLPIDRVKAAITELQTPDAESRSKELEGRRIELLDPERGWGWKIVNYLYYRDLRNEETRREQNREAQARFKRQQVSRGKPTVSNGNQDNESKPMQKQRHMQKDIVSPNGDTPAPPALVPTVEDIYSAYPLKKERPQALKAIRAACKRHGAAFLLERTVAYAKTRNGDLSFMPYPQKWFNREGYNDDPETWKTKHENTTSTPANGNANERRNLERSREHQSESSGSAVPTL